MNADICRADESREVLTAERCSILELANDASDPAVSIARARAADDDLVFFAVCTPRFMQSAYRPGRG